ncbi:hypothetical protein [Roseovarius sp. ZX-A-9]|uniref:hypothetical protein n=1 Tax=Roseovarius sp. ZX-A-9 TaxID=3014783 RepID=UPI0023304FF1|nr:hypothetical protein [Roseovarius sp. ZX-A-9]
MTVLFHKTKTKSSIISEFGRLVAHIRVAQAAEKEAHNLEEKTGEDHRSLTDVADTSWSYAYILSDEIKEIEPKVDLDKVYLEVAALLRGLLDAQLFEREFFADRAVEKRAELGSENQLSCSDLVDALNFLVGQDWLPNDDPEALDLSHPGFT